MITSILVETKDLKEFVKSCETLNVNILNYEDESDDVKNVYIEIKYNSKLYSLGRYFELEKQLTKVNNMLEH